MVRLFSTLRRSWAHTIGLVLLLVCSILVTIWIAGRSYDDAYITYRYAYNLATGHGFAYNVGEHQLGTTTPLFAILLGTIGSLSPDNIPVIASWLSGLSMLAAAWAVLIYSNRHRQPLVGLLAGLSLVFCPLLLDTFGGEALLFLALTLWAMIAYDARREGIAGLLLGLAAVTRGDGLIPMALLCIHSTVRMRRLPIRMLLGFTIPFGAWSLVAFATYGSLFPSTLSAKMAQGASGHWWSFLQGLKFVAQQYLGHYLIFGPASHPALRLFLVLIVPGLLALIALSRYWILPLAWSALHLAGYVALRVPFYTWYFAPGAFAIAVLSGIALGAIPELLKWATSRWKWSLRPDLATLAGTLIAFALVVPALADAIAIPSKGKLAIQYPYPAVPYRPMGEWLAVSTDPKATIGYMEIGYIGFYSHRTIVDTLGLVTPGAADHVRQGELDWGYRHYLPDYILVNPAFKEFLGTYLQEPWFLDGYRLVHSVDQLEVYQRSGQIAWQDRLSLEQAQPLNDRASDEILPDRHVGQTFLANDDNLRGVALLLTWSGEAPRAPLEFHLAEVEGKTTGPDFVRMEIEPASIVNNSWRVFFFPPVANSKGKTYQIDLSSPLATAGSSVSAWATSKDSYDQGSLMINGQPAPGDLAFKIFYVSH